MRRFLALGSYLRGGAIVASRRLVRPFVLEVIADQLRVAGVADPYLKRDCQVLVPALPVPLLDR
ncbi:MAG: hypothetical protein ACRDX8_14080 [Acidimicrobiales bacterium]